MSVAIQISNIDGLGTALVVKGFLVPAGIYPTGGDVVDFTGVNSTITKAPGFTGDADSITSQYMLCGFAESIAGLLGYPYSLITPTNNAPSGAKLKIGSIATLGTELSAGAYPAAVTGDVIAFEATFKKNNV